MTDSRFSSFHVGGYVYSVEWDDQPGISSIAGKQGKEGTVERS